MKKQMSKHAESGFEHNLRLYTQKVCNRTQIVEIFSQVTIVSIVSQVIELIRLVTKPDPG
jgi:hypothetical protein